MTGLSNKTVRDVMTTDVVTVDREMSYKAVVELMQQHKISGVPVVGADNVVIGVVSEADLLRKPERYDRSGPPVRVGGLRTRSATHKANALDANELMTTPAVTIESAATIAVAARVMAKHRIKRLPVVDESGHLIGVVSRSDLLRVFLRSDAEIRDEVVSEVFGRVLWAHASSVDVLVEDGMVALTGRLERRSEVAIAGTLTASLDGVVTVQNRLEYEIDDSEPYSAQVENR